MSRRALVPMVLLLAECRRAAPHPPRVPGTTLAVASPDVEFGRAFPLTVTRVAGRGAPTEGEPSLAPLVTRLEAAATDEEGEPPVVVDERRYRAWAFRAGEVELPSLQLHVRSSLPADDAGRPELPEEPLDVPRPSRALPLLALAGAAALALAAIAFVRARRRARRAVVGAARVSAEARARARLQQLRARPLVERADLLALHDEAAALLRDYVQERFEPRAASRTSEELVEGAARAPSLGAAPRARLAALLPPLDRVRFGRATATADRALRLLDELEAFVGETSP